MGNQGSNHRILIFALAVLGVFIFMAAVQAAPAAAADWYVVSGGTGNENGSSWENAAPSIENVVRDNAADGDVIHVGDGTYVENINVDKSVTIIGENGPSKVIVISDNENDHTFEVLDNNVTIAGFTIAGANGTGPIAGVYVGDVENVLIENNVVENNDHGIWFNDSFKCTADNNIVRNEKGDGIYLYGADNITVGSINVLDNIALWAIDVYYGENNVVTGNTVENGSEDGIYISHSTDATVFNNLVGNFTTSTGVGIKLSQATGSSVDNNTVDNCIKGIYIYNTEDVTLENNTVDNTTSYGIHLENDNYIALSNNNTVENNSDDGIYLLNSDNVTLSGVTIENTSGHGILLESSDNAKITATVRYLGAYGVYVKNTDNLVISGSTIENANGGTGIYLLNAPNATVQTTIVDNSSSYGVYIEDSDNLTLSFDNVRYNSGRGIDLYYSDNARLENVLVESNSSYGVYVYLSEGLTMDNTQMLGNQVNFYVYGTDLSQFMHDIDNTNRVDAGPVLYLTGDENNLVINQDNQVGWLGLVNSDNILSENLAVESVLLAFTNNSWVENLLVENAADGIWLENAENNTIIRNTVKNCTKVGILLTYSDNNDVYYDNIDNTDSVGVYLYYSDTNDIYSNTIENIRDDGIVLWQSEHNNVYYNDVENVQGTGIYVNNSNYSNLYYNSVENTTGTNFGISILSSNYCTIYGDNVKNTKDAGIQFYNSQNGFVDNVLVENTAPYGIYINGSSSSTVQNSTVENTNYGVYLRTSDSITISNLTVRDSIYNGIHLQSSNDSTIQLNTLENNDNCSIFVIDSENVAIDTNTIDNFNLGIYLDNLDSSTISGNCIENGTDNAITLTKHSDYNTISGNSVENVGGEGIGLDNSHYNTITNNTVENAQYGLYQVSSTYNTVYQATNSFDNICGFLTITGVGSSPSTNSASVSWTTTETADNNIVEYGKTAGYGSSVTSTTSTTSHSLSITGIVSQTTFHFRVWSADSDNHNMVISGDSTFTTSKLSTPTISSSTHSEGVATSDSAPSFSWSQVGDAAVVDFKYMLYPYESSWQTTSSTSVSYSGVSDGEYTFKLKAYDGGGESGVDEYTIVIDTGPSSIELSGIAATATETGTGWTLSTTQGTFTLSATVEPGSQVTINGTSVTVSGDGSFSKVYNLSPGQNVFTIRVTDAAGNITEKTLTVNYSGATMPTTAGPPVSGPMLFIVAVIILILVVVGVVFRFTSGKK